MKKSEARTSGFTLIELLIVMVIIGLLAAFVAPRFFGQEEKAKQRGAKGQIALLESALDTYRLDVGSYPTTEQGLEALREQPARDPWGRPYVYESPSEHGDYAIWSYGADGKDGGDGADTDIVSWKDLGQ